MICSLQMDAVSVNNSLSLYSQRKADQHRGRSQYLCDADNGNTNIELNGGRSGPEAAASP